MHNLRFRLESSKRLTGTSPLPSNRTDEECQCVSFTYAEDVRDADVPYEFTEDGTRPGCPEWIRKWIVR